jgi:hypothetical protein
MATTIAQLPGEIRESVPNVQLKKKEITTEKKVPLNSINKIISGIQKAAESDMTSLPNRDIPHEPERITRDPQIQPNYIPQTTQNLDYIEEDMNYEEMMKRNKNEKKEKDRLDVLYDELQTPLIIAILFFAFQLPIVNKLLLKFTPSLFLKDGNPKFTGYLFKTSLFSLLYYVSNKTLTTFSEF